MTRTSTRPVAAALGVAVPLLLLGCDPESKDAEVDFGTDVSDSGATGNTGTESTPYGPENSWYHADSSDIPDGLSGTGNGTGDIASNFTLLDQFGQEVELYQFYGQVIVIDAFAEW